MPIREGSKNIEKTINDSKIERENSIIWQLGKPHKAGEIIDKEFMNIKTLCYRYDVPEDWKELATFELPKILAGSSDLGCVRLEIEFIKNTAEYLPFRAGMNAVFSEAGQKYWNAIY